MLTLTIENELLGLNSFPCYTKLGELDLLNNFLLVATHPHTPPKGGKLFLTIFSVNMTFFFNTFPKVISYELLVDELCCLMSAHSRVGGSTGPRGINHSSQPSTEAPPQPIERQGSYLLLLH